VTTSDLEKSQREHNINWGCNRSRESLNSQFHGLEQHS